MMTEVVGFLRELLVASLSIEADLCESRVTKERRHECSPIGLMRYGWID